MTVSVHDDFVRIFDGPTFWGLDPGHAWYQAIAAAMPDKEAIERQISRGVGAPVLPHGQYEHGGGRSVVGTKDGSEVLIGRKKFHAKFLVSQEMVVSGDTESICSLLLTGWQLVGAEMRRRHPDASLIAMVSASTMQHWNNKRHRIAISDDQDGFDVVGAVHYYPIPKDVTL